MTITNSAEIIKAPIFLFFNFNAMYSKKFLINCFLTFFFSLLYFSSLAQVKQPLRIIMFGAHPDDCDMDGGGTAILFSKMGYAVKFVSVTNGDAGHQTQKGLALARRRLAEAKEAGRRFGVTYDVLDNHDGLLMPELAVRLQIIRKIREWNADLVFAPRPNDYHPDHRYTGVLVQDASYMVVVPNMVPEVPALKKNPVFVYFQDRFQKPNAFRPDIAIDISSVYDQKVYALDAHVSQVYEWLPWVGHYSEQVPSDTTARKSWLHSFSRAEITPEVSASLIKWYGKERGEKVAYAEAFEICEYGSQPDEEEKKRLFPMLRP